MSQDTAESVTGAEDRDTATEFDQELEGLVEEDLDDGSGDGEVVEPAEVEADDTEEPPAAGALGLPWWAVAAITIVLLLIYGIVMNQAWEYIVTTGEKAERGDWDQLNSILDKVDYVVLFVLGAVLGVTVQNRQTQAARNAAKKNQASAKKQRETALRNKHVARENKRTALTQGTVARQAAKEMDGVRRAIQDVQRDPDVSFVRGPVTSGPMAAASPGGRRGLDDEAPGHVVIPEERVSPTSSALDDLARRLDLAATRVRDKAL